MQMEIDESGPYLNDVFEKNECTKTNCQINGTLGRGVNIQNAEESFLELSDRLSVPDGNVDQEELNNNCFEQFICSKCNIPKPSARLLDIHIQEDHDNIFFKLLSKKQPMYECYVQKCNLKFNSQSERDEHCSSIHKYTKSFGTFLHRGQLEKWESINTMNEQNLSQKRKHNDDFESNKKIACETNVINEFQTEESKSTLKFVPRQILLDKNSAMNLRTHLA
ncbi:zinc finger protein 511 [Leptopilina heterotoma]|uniref:zinc finger protein 511 n=1 Tax=Leptopilina heterotoma TaxID=63436 RepID=UPI001CA83A48|nr:zinc finger protein 511 [Leptopilina heterotoma]